MTKLSREKKLSQSPGFCVDTGALKPVVGARELRKMSLVYYTDFKHSGSPPNRFRFASITFESIGRVRVPLAAPNGKPPVVATLEVVPADIPVLLVVDVLDREGLVVETEANRLTKRAK